MKSKLAVSFLLLTLILTACGPADTDPTAIPTQTNTPIPSATLKPGETPPTPTDTPIPSDTPEPSETPTPLPDLSAISILSYGHAGGGQYFITFTGIEGLDISGLTFLANGKTYTCSIPADFPDRLYCTGPTFELGTVVHVQVLLGDVVIWEGEFMVPYPEPTATSEARDGAGGSGDGGGDSGESDDDCEDWGTCDDDSGDA